MVHRAGLARCLGQTATRFSQSYGDWAFYCVAITAYHAGSLLFQAFGAYLTPIVCPSRVPRTVPKTNGVQQSRITLH